jgi:pimeloyl-ACP methyl ester carboxylesterase
MLRFDKVRLPTGPQLHYAQQGAVDAEAIVFLHGWPDSWFSFSRVLSLLPLHVHSLAIDQRGFGDSDRPEYGYRIPDLAGDVLAFLDALKIDRATIVGHSFGSFVARHLATAQPARVTRLVLIGTGFTTSSAVVSDLPVTLRDLTDPVPVEFARDFQTGTVYHPVPADFFERIITESMKLPARLWRELIDRLLEYDDAQQLSGIVPPTLLIWGDHDALFSRAHQDRFIAACPRARLTVYEETGHCPNWERPERVAGDILSFLENAHV